jgi:YHS domain-containing protein
LEKRMKDMFTIVLLGVSIFLGTAASLHAQQGREPVTCLRGLDPVALVQGVELPGDSGYAVTRGRYRYLFANAANRKTFEDQAERYSIQLGGGCGRMGPLAGLGSPDRFWVHDGRIFIFASDQCMESFRSAPAQHIESNDPAPTGSNADVDRGTELVLRAIEGFGGSAKLDAITSLEWKRVRTYQVGGEDKEHTILTRMAFPDRFRVDEIWHSGSSWDFVNGIAGYRVASDGEWPMDEMVRREFIKAMRRSPIVLLKARGEPGFQSVRTGNGMVGEQGVEWLSIGLDGATTTLGVHVPSGRVLCVQYRGRAPAAIGKVTQTFSDFRDLDGIVYPFTVTTSLNDTPGLSRTFASVTVNARFDNQLFIARD